MRFVVLPDQLGFVAIFGLVLMQEAVWVISSRNCSNIIGFWTTKAASAFKQIVATQGNDIENLGALAELRKLYTRYWLYIVA